MYVEYVVEVVEEPITGTNYRNLGLKKGMSVGESVVVVILLEDQQGGPAPKQEDLYQERNIPDRADSNYRRS